MRQGSLPRGPAQSHRSCATPAPRERRQTPVMADVGASSRRRLDGDMSARDAQRPDDVVPFGVRVAAAWAWRLLLIAAATGVAAYVAATLRLVVVPAVLAVFLTVLLEPFKHRLERAGMATALAALVALAAAVVVLGGLLALLIPPVVDELDTLTRDVEAGASRVVEWVAEGPLNAGDGDVSAVVDRLRDNVDVLGSGVLAGATLLAEAVAALLLALVFTFFLLKDGRRLWRWVLSRVPARRRPAAAELGRRIWATLGAYLRGVLIVALFDAVFIGLALVVLGVPLALPLTVVTFIGAFIPIVGALAAGAAATLVALVTGGVDQALLVLAAVIVVQQVESQILSPVVLGRAVKLHPGIVLVSVTAGAVLYGVVGAALATPVAAIIGAAATVAGADGDPVSASSATRRRVPRSPHENGPEAREPSDRP